MTTSAELHSYLLALQTSTLSEREIYHSIHEFGREHFLDAREVVEHHLYHAEAHTFFVGDGQWLVHNACDQFLKELDNGAKIRAYFEEGIMWTSMWVPKDLRGQGLGNELFNDAWNAIGGESRVRAIGGDWGTYMPDNLDSFNRNIANGMSEVDAALNTFTGKQAVKHRFTTVEFQQMSDGPPYKFVKVVFR